MTKSRTARKGSISRAGESPPTSPNDVGFPLPRDPPNYQLRSGALEGEQEVCDGSGKPASADVLADSTDGASTNSKVRVSTDSKDLQRWIAWKWRWAVEANKAKGLSRKINELNSNNGKVRRDAVRNHNYSKDHSQIKNDRALARRRTPRPVDLNLKALPAPISSPSSMQSPSALQALENGDLQLKGSTEMQNLQKQVSKLTACFNKMMPTLIFLVNRAGSQKLVNHCFSQWKALSYMNCLQLNGSRRNNNQTIKPCSRVLKGLGITQLSDFPSQRQRTQRKASMAGYTQPKFEPTPHASPSATLKALQTLQASMHHDLDELQGIMVTEMENLKRQVEARRPIQNINRYGSCGESSRWKQDLLSMWELCSYVEQLLNKARYKLTSSGELPATVRPRGYVPIHCRNRHRYACHPIISITTPEPPHRTVRTSPSAAPVIRITSPEPSQGNRRPPPTPIGKCGETVVRVSPTRTNGCHVRITPKGSGRLVTHIQEQEEGQGRQCLAAKHAASLLRQIERLKARHQSACVRLQYHEKLYPWLPQKPTLTLLQHTSLDDQKRFSKETQT